VIDIDELVAVVTAYLDTDRTAACHGITRASDQVPRYSPTVFRPEICTKASVDRNVAATCRAFYNGLPLDEGTVQCPFGIRVSYYRVGVSGRPFCLYQHTGTGSPQSTVSALPRKSKKLARTALGNNYEIIGNEAVGKFERGKELISTLLTGRVAESIRALSHHLLTPLQGAIGDVEALDSGERQPSTIQRLKRNLADVDASAKQIQILLSDEVEYAPQRLRKIPVHAVVKDVIDRLSASAERRCIVIEHGANRQSAQVQAIPDQFAVVVTAILQNCVKYSFEGRPERNRVVRISYSAERDNLVIRFANEGCGIDPDEIRDGRIFELGYRGRRSADRGRTGTGTGLYIADKITRAHGGLIRAKSILKPAAIESHHDIHENTFELVWPVYSPLIEDR